MEVYFKNLDVASWSGFTVILDVDGTLAPDGQADMDNQVVAKVLELKKNNTVFLCSNKRDTRRNMQVSQALQLAFLDTPVKKPGKKIIESIPQGQRANFLVIGDKFLTDGVLAKNIGAKFIKTKRLTGRTDNFFSKCIYFFDDLIYFLAGS